MSPPPAAGPRWVTDGVAALARVGARAVAAGLVVATGGNLSVRSPGGRELLVTARGAELDDLDATTVTTMDLDGTVLAGPEPSTEWRLHQRAYLARPDVGAVVHLHPPHLVLLDALRRPLRLLTLDHVAYVGAVARVPFLPNGSDELADAAAQALHGADAVVLAHHGCSCVGPDPRVAYRTAATLESAAVATYRMLLLGDTGTEFPPDLRAGAVQDRPAPPGRIDVHPADGRGSLGPESLGPEGGGGTRGTVRPVRFEQG